MTLLAKHPTFAVISHNDRTYTVDFGRFVRVEVAARINRRRHSRCVYGPLATKILAFVASN